MKKLLSFISALVLVQASSSAQTYSQDLSVMLDAQVQTSPAQIRIKWPADPDATQFRVYRKAPSATGWGAAIATLAGTDTAYTDNAVSTGTLYEYRVQRTTPSGTTYGYLLSGIETSLNYNKGWIIPGGRQLFHFYARQRNQYTCSRL